jgi:hypothetical protein
LHHEAWRVKAKRASPCGNIYPTISARRFPFAHETFNREHRLNEACEVMTAKVLLYSRLGAFPEALEGAAGVGGMNP